MFNDMHVTFISFHALNTSNFVNFSIASFMFWTARSTFCANWCGEKERVSHGKVVGRIKVVCKAHMNFAKFYFHGGYKIVAKKYWVYTFFLVIPWF